MFYAINRNTKKHIKITDILTHNVCAFHHDWRIVEADAEGWIDRDDRECPLPEGVRFDARMRGGVEALDEPPCTDATLWRHEWGRADIIAYRPILDDKPEAPEWDGEGLPPVGCHLIVDGECEVEVVGYYAGDVVFVGVDNGVADVAPAHNLSNILTAAQRAEDEAVEAIDDALRGTEVGSTARARNINASAIYAAIRDGKIPGVRLDD